MKRTFLIKITGLVQGVGFRPFIYRIAKEQKLNGWVENRNDGVLIKVSTTINLLEQFIKSIKQRAPLSAEIRNIEFEEKDNEILSDFTIKKSKNLSSEITEVSPDIAVCKSCLADLKSQAHRINYPLINCTNCGPRFSIIKDLPYDRDKTSMVEFEMCETCKNEYEEISDRRFHAQPVACNNCGPQYQFLNSKEYIGSFNQIIQEIAVGIEEGAVYALKGTGGFHLLCDALNDGAVQKLRNIKQRDKKPFAVMFKSLEQLRLYVEINEQEESELNSWRRPIVLLKKKKNLAKGIADSMNTLGVMLPYMPFHYLLFEKLKTPAVVLTSGNISGEPIIISDEEANNKLEGKLDKIISYNRKIHNRTDDSVIFVANNKTNIIRRSRAYAPSSILTNLKCEGIFAAGAELVNSFCIGKGNLAFLSQYIGDLKNQETFSYYEETYARFRRLFKFSEEFIVCDLHPDYLSSQFAEKLAVEKNVPLIKIQHHHAHIASVMCDYGIEEKVIGISFDGIGLGADKNIWGAEFMVVDYLNFDRKYHFEYIPMPGADKASMEPWRMAISYLLNTYGNDFIDKELPLFKKVDVKKIRMVIQMIEKSINSPLTSSAGRLFDAVSAVIGLVYVSDYHAEAPMKLESIIESNVDDYYEYEILNNLISFKKCIQQIIIDKSKNVSNGIIAAKFHNTIIQVILEVSVKLNQETGINKIALSGGTFQNKYIISHIERLLSVKGFEVLLPRKVPANDQGIALGQLAIAAKKREMNLI